MDSDDADDTLDEATPAERLRALELSGDPDAREIARQYKSTPLDGVRSTLRQVTRASRQSTEVFRPTYAQATEADADEADEKVALMRAERERERSAQEQQMHNFAKAADRREASMLRLTRASVVIALASLLASAAAVVIAVAGS